MLGDRLLLCSDGASGVLDDGRLADILSMGTPDYAAVELVRASLEAGTNDNVTCIVADVVEETEVAPDQQQPMLVGAAADLRRRLHVPVPNMFRGHRAGDTGELEPVRAEIPDSVPPFAIETDPVDPEEARYAPRPPRRFLFARRVLAAVAVLGLVWMGGAAAYSWSQKQYYVGEQDGNVTIFRGLNADVPGIDLSHPYETSNVSLDRLTDYNVSTIRDGIDADSLGDARTVVRRLAENQSVDDAAEATDTATPSPTETATPTATPTGTPTGTATPSAPTSSATAG